MTLPDGLVAFVKRDCPTCALVEPVLGELADAGILNAVYTQDDPTFPRGIAALHDDTGLEASWRNGIETVPTILRVEEGREADRIVGWSREQWTAFTSVADLGAGLPEHRPGCGSLSADPDRAAGLEAQYGDGFASRRVEFASAEDPMEAMHDRGWSDGLPLVEPTTERVARMLRGTARDRQDVVAIVPPNLVECTVEKVAVNAVMAGCKPEYLPVVLAAVATACTDAFNMHGLLCTTMSVGPVVLVNGPIRNAIGMNSGVNVLGQGNRANSTIGRALQLVVRNVGGGEPGGIDRSTLGNPGKVGFCFAEDEEGSPWPSFSQSRGFGPRASTVTLFPGESPRIVVDQVSRTPEALAASLGSALIGTNHPRLVMATDAMLVISPEHASRFAAAGWSKERTVSRILEATCQPAEGLWGIAGEGDGAAGDAGPGGVAKFRPDGLHVVHAGGRAGLFSAVIGGWVAGDKGSHTVTKEVSPWA
ncbi:MAG TPA: thioredoxin family protein [Acidimicrobiia bacterium]|jgi:hypothetical protein|nr:thioredoxin family protein [Acidimicrobiia bacterium]